MKLLTDTQLSHTCIIMILSEAITYVMWVPGKHNMSDIDWGHVERLVG